MQHVDNFMNLKLIIGPMFSGKTSALIRDLQLCSDIGLKCIYVNSTLDNRSENNYSTHNPLIKSIGTFDSIKMDYLDTELFLDYDVIGIDESQFFTGLFDNVLQLVDSYHKKVIIAGLSGDFRREPFGEILTLVSYADKIEQLYAFCDICKSNNRICNAIFSKRITHKSEKVDIGSKDKYLAVCRSCFLN